MSPIHPVTAFLASLLLIVPTYGALGTTTNGGLWLWFVGGIAVVALLGLLLRAVVPQALALVLLATSTYLVVALAALFVVAGAGDPPGDGVLALLVGVPAAAAAALVAAPLTGHLETDALPPAVIAIVLVGLVGVTVAPAAGEAVEDARDEAAQITRLEASGLVAYLPELDDLDVRGSLTSTKDGEVIAYSYRYEVDADAPASPAISLDVVGELPAYRDCDSSDRAIYQCRREDGYYVLTRDGTDQYVVADHGNTYLLAWYVEPGDGLPDADAVGRALSDAEEVAWSDVVGLD